MDIKTSTFASLFNRKVVRFIKETTEHKHYTLNITHYVLCNFIFGLSDLVFHIGRTRPLVHQGTIAESLHIVLARLHSCVYLFNVRVCMSHRRLFCRPPNPCLLCVLILPQIPFQLNGHFCITTSKYASCRGTGKTHILMGTPSMSREMAPMAFASIPTGAKCSSIRVI